MSDAFSLKYKVIQKIGEGSFSDVIKCENRSTGVQYAAKRLKKLFRNITDVVSCAEIKAMLKLTRHPNVLYMTEYLYDPHTGRLIFIFELMDMSMYEFMKVKKRSITELRVKNFLYQILRGLEHLHRNGLFHRDIKPENILIKLLGSSSSLPLRQPREIVKLADLGSVRGIYSAQPFTEYISTRWYRSPECLLTNGNYGPKMDIWATGCVFYEMLTLKPLFPGSNEIDQLARIHNILGTPSRKLLLKIKKHIKSLPSFPRVFGRGLDNVITNISDDGRAVLHLMIQYDPDLRVNVRRLIEHRYFSAQRDQDMLLVCKNRGDYPMSALMSYISNASSINKSREKASSKDGIYSPSSKFASLNDHLRNSTNIRLKTPEGFRKLLVKSWVEDPIRYKNAVEISSHRGKPLRKGGETFIKHPKPSSDPNDVLRKTTTQLPQLKRKLDGTCAQRNPQFGSKSMVMPQRVAGKIKIPPGGCDVPKTKKLMK